MGRISATAILLACASSGIWGQAFDVASIRLNQSKIRGGSVDFPAGRERFTAANMPLAALIIIAYDVTARQLSGPDALLSEKYDIAAKAEHAASREEMLRMLQALLSDRFKLVLRQETREVPVYALTIAKGGPKLGRSALPQGAGPTPRIPALAGGTEPGRGRLAFRNESMDDFAWALSRVAGIGDRVVVDRTGLNGTYDFELTFLREGERERGPQPGDIEGPSIFTAVEEQLGLRLESKKEPVRFLIVESVERPSEN